MNRRRLLASGAVLLAAPLAKAQRMPRIGFLGAASGPGFANQISAFRSVPELEAAIESIRERRADAIVFHEEPMHLVNAQKLIALAAKHRLATAGPLEFVPASAVFAYGVHFPELYRRAAFFVDKILKGVKPADIPVEQASRFEFVINLKAARAIGLSIPAHLVPRADKVIE